MFRSAVAALIALLLAAPAAAQAPAAPPQPATAAPEPRIAFTFGYPARAGILWQPTGLVAVRAEFSLAYNGSSGAQGSIEWGEWIMGPSVSGLFSLYQNTPFRIYAGPRYAFRRHSYSADSGQAFQLETKRSEHAIGGVGGLEFRYNERIRLYAEAGAEYSRSSQSSNDVRGSLDGTFRETNPVGIAGMTVSF